MTGDNELAGLLYRKNIRMKGTREQDHTNITLDTQKALTGKKGGSKYAACHTY